MKPTFVPQALPAHAFMADPAPRISIALCTYNGSAYLPAQLRSLAAQTRRPDELVVFDDASTDGTLQVLRDFAASAPFPVRLHANEHNVGLSLNFQQAIESCTGDVIALCDQDDVWYPQKLKRIEEAFGRHPEAGFVFSDADICDDEAKPLGYRLWSSVNFTPSLREKLLSGRAFEVILRQNVVTGATMAFAARFKPLVCPVSERWIHDGWIGLLVSAVAPVAIIDEPLIAYRQHARQTVGALRRTFYQQYQAAKKMDRNVFARHADMYQAAYDRLAALNGKLTRADDVLPRLREKIAHFRLRSEIRLRQRSRFVPAVTELATLRYRKYSLGWKSFAQDLFL